MNDCVGGTVPDIAEVHEATVRGVGGAVEVEVEELEELLDELLEEVDRLLEEVVVTLLDEVEVVEVVVFDVDDVRTK
ncbi:MAG: hypothetical protein JRN44_00155 [Nitrososphaerota archaeon]|nr:hypothetical protein [Nitrososphaerota archaeon]MDG6941909.1 hypothetical protein [Nitrososphaerota archaeon]MDG6946918.1 hypothetical protein [Nitrososphaerota archaeon]